MIKKTKIIKIYSLIIKITIIILAFGFIYRRLIVKENIDEMLQLFTQNLYHRSFIKPLGGVLILMFLNWTLETIKWRFLIRKIEKVPFFKSLVAVLSGITVSIFTPNRIGEYAGRVFVLEKASRWEGVLITMLGSMSQLMVTIIAGSIGFVFFAKKYIFIDQNPAYYLWGLILIIALLAVLLLLVFLNISVLSKVIYKLPKKFKKISRYGRIFSFYKKKELFIVLGLSVARYFVFVTQFYILLRFFKVPIPYNDAFLLITIIYLVMAAIPTIALTELGIRGSVSLYFIGLYFTSLGILCSYDMGIITATTVLWIINLVIPAITGAIFVFRLKFFRKNDIT